MNRQKIKFLAIAAMTIDHIALVFVPSDSILYYVMRLIGRLTAPLMTFIAYRGVSAHAQQNKVSAAPCHIRADITASLFQVSIRTRAGQHT